MTAVDPGRVHPLREVLRYLAVVVVGLGVDVGISYAAHVFLGLPLMAGAAIGFLTGVLVNYMLFEFWVFRTGRMTWGRLGKAYLAAQGAFLVRLGSVWTLSRLLAALVPSLPRLALVTLMLAAGLSFVVNFVLVRLLLKSKPQHQNAKAGS